MAATVLIYHMEENRRQILEGLCHSMGIRPVSVEETSHRAPVGILSGNVDMKVLMQGVAGADQPGPGSAGPLDSGSMAQAGSVSSRPISEEMIVMCDFTKTQFDTLLEALKMAGLRIGLKAVETPTNQMWSGEMLQEELSREREAFRRKM